MLPYQSLVLVDRANVLPVYKQISTRLIGLIQDGIIQPGVYFPGTRQMADLMHVNRKTVISAYDELLLREWIEAVPRKGYRVKPQLPGIKPRSFHPKNNFLPAGSPIAKHNYDNIHTPWKRQITNTDIVVNDGFPDPALAPFKDLSNLYRDSIATEKILHLMSLPDEGGLNLLKEAASSFLNETRGLNIGKADMVITRGAQMAIYIAASIMLKPGDNVVVSDPNYIFANEIFAGTGANIITVKVDNEGLDVDELAQIPLTKPVKLLYIVPHHHHPTTVTLSATRRLKLLQLIGQFNFHVIEDDYDYDFHYNNNPILPLASSAHNGNIIYIGSFTKLLAPSMRIGYLIAAPEIVKKAIHLRRLIDLRGDTFMEYILAKMIISGDLSRHINKANKLYAQRCAFTCDMLSRKLSHAVEFTKPNGGMAIWLRFREQYPVNKIRDDAARNGLLLTGMAFHQPGNPNGNGIRFGFASLSEEKIEWAIDILLKILK
ncbi:PLP-dependent aminotransferase family protein [Mucilaginibacter gynuensis]|uniref:PLP-dependent aminotransferase family protein n=1 Tax=Mucilaginibacter gynuensis TaxID=1302236 RepID=A0ABP8GFQ2_9SPHI